VLGASQPKHGHAEEVARGGDRASAAAPARTAPRLRRFDRDAAAPRRGSPGVCHAGIDLQAVRTPRAPRRTPPVHGQQARSLCAAAESGPVQPVPPVAARPRGPACAAHSRDSLARMIRWSLTARPGGHGFPRPAETHERHTSCCGRSRVGIQSDGLLEVLQRLRRRASRAAAPCSIGARRCAVQPQRLEDVRARFLEVAIVEEDQREVCGQPGRRLRAIVAGTAARRRRSRGSDATSMPRAGRDQDQHEGRPAAGLVSTAAARGSGTRTRRQ